MSRQKELRETSPRCGFRWPLGFACVASCILLLVGCSVFRTTKGTSLESEVGQADTRATDTAELAEPDAVDRSQPNETESGKVSKVRLDGSLSLGDTDHLAYEPEQLAVALAELYSAGQLASAQTLVRDYPDVVAKIMLQPNTQRLTRKQQSELCDQYAKLWTSDTSGIQQLKNSLASGTTVSVLQQHKTFLTQLENNRPEEALRLRIGRQLSEPSLLHAESLRLEGMAKLMLEDHAGAAAKFSQAVEILDSKQPVEANRIRLLLGESWRRAGDENAWKEAWTQAVMSHSALLVNRQLADPQFWKQAAFLRPVSAPWPEKVTDRLYEFNRKYGLDHEERQRSEASVWMTIGLNSLRRHESQNAILSFKKAEALVSDRFLKKELQLKQALAMIDGGQPGPASAILFRISSETGTIADRAKAILATMKLQNGSLAQGMGLLQAAIQSSNQWPADERLRAQADYGLAYLMRGKEQQGVALLEQIYREFLSRGDYPQAIQCLSNIATYFEKTDKPGEHRAVVARLKKLEASPR